MPVVIPRQLPRKKKEKKGLEKKRGKKAYAMVADSFEDWLVYLVPGVG